MKLTQLETIKQLLDRNGIKTNIWSKIDKERLYFSSLGKDISAWLEVEEIQSIEFDDIFQGVQLKVFSNAECCSRKWLINRSKQIKHCLMIQLYEILKNESTFIAKAKPCETWQEVIL